MSSDWWSSFQANKLPDVDFQTLPLVISKPSSKYLLENRIYLTVSLTQFELSFPLDQVAKVRLSLPIQFILYQVLTYMSVLPSFLPRL